MYCCWDPYVTMLRGYPLPHYVRYLFVCHAEGSPFWVRLLVGKASRVETRNSCWGHMTLLWQRHGMYIITISNIIWSDLHHLDTWARDIDHTGWTSLSNVSCSWFYDRCHFSSYLSMHMWFFYALLNAILTTSQKQKILDNSGSWRILDQWVLKIHPSRNSSSIWAMTMSCI